MIYFYDEILSKKQLELNSKNKYFVIDIMVYSVKDAIEIFGDKCDIYFLGLLNEKDSIKMLHKQIIPENTSFEKNDLMLDFLSDGIVQSTKYLYEECKKHNVKFFDLSGDFDKKIKQAILEVENNSINC